MRNKRATQADVAKRAGVSRGTVSLTLNNTPNHIQISEDTRARVLQAARELGYSSNPVAQMLVRGSNRIIGFLTFDESFPFASEDFYFAYLIGMQSEASKQGYNVLLFTSGEVKLDEATWGGEQYQPSISTLRLADGLILTGNYPKSVVLRRLAKEQHKFVLLGSCDMPSNEMDSVEHNHQPASCQAAQHLIELGHRQLGFVVGEDLPHHRERLAGVQQAITAHNTASNDPVALIILCKNDLRTSAQLQTKLNQHRITALIGADRHLIKPTLHCLNELSLRIPQDISIIFLSYVPHLPFAHPTHVRLNREEAGRVGVRRLMQRFANPDQPFQQIRIPCEFIVGETTGKVISPVP